MMENTLGYLSQEFVRLNTQENDLQSERARAEREIEHLQKRLAEIDTSIADVKAQSVVSGSSSQLVWSLADSPRHLRAATPKVELHLKKQATVRPRKRVSR